MTGMGGQVDPRATSAAPSCSPLRSKKTPSTRSSSPCPQARTCSATGRNTSSARSRREFERIVSEEHLKTGLARAVHHRLLQGRLCRRTDRHQNSVDAAPCVTLRAEQRVRADEEPSRRTVPPILRSLRRNVRERPSQGPKRNEDTQTILLANRGSAEKILRSPDCRLKTSSLSNVQTGLPLS